MRLTITLDLDNDAFQGRAFIEAANIISTELSVLDLYRKRVRREGASVPLRDTNGNTCGQLEVTL